MEENLQFVLSLIKNKNYSMVAAMDHLASSLSVMHTANNCSLFTKKLDSLSVLMKVVSASDKDKKENLLVVEKVIDVCFEVLFSLTDANDLCIQAICSLASSSLIALPEHIILAKITFIIHKCKSNMLEFVENRSVLYDVHDGSCIEICKLRIQLRICECIIEFLTSDKVKFDRVEGSRFFVDIKALFENDFIVSLLKLFAFEQNILTSQVLSLIPKMVILCESNSVIMKIWENISDTFCNSHNVSSHTYLIMCALSDYLIPCEYSVLHYSVAENNNFWKILQCGLVSRDAFIRKQALYLLKKAVEHVSIQPVPYCNIPEMLFWWNHLNTQEFHKVWNDLFLLLEVLEEKQMHLVEPVQPILSFLIKACAKNIIHSSWILCIIERALTHESNAVVRWGIVCFTDLDFNVYMTKFGHLRILNSLLNALNNASFYVTRNHGLLLPDIVQKLISFFIAAARSDLVLCQHFFRNLLTLIVRISWGPVALFYIIYALGGVSKCPVWTLSDIKLLKNFLLDALATQVIHIRGAIQTFFIEALIKLSDEHTMELNVLADLIGCFQRSECLKRRSHSWQKVISWLKSFTKENDAFLYAQKMLNAAISSELECDKKAAARMLILLSDAELINLDIHDLYGIHSLRTDLLSFVHCFENCHRRLYICPEKQNSCLELLIHMLDECQPIEKNDITGKNVVSLISGILPDIFFYIERNMFTAHNLQSFDIISLHLFALSVFSKEQQLYFKLLNCAGILQNACLSIVNSYSEDALPITTYFVVQVLTWISNLIKKGSVENIRRHKVFEKQMAFSEKLICGKTINSVLTKTEHDKLLTRNLQVLWGRCVAEHMQSIWCIINNYIDFQLNISSLNVDFERADQLLREASEALEVGGRGTLIPVMSVIEQLMYVVVSSDSEELTRFMSVCWTGIFELRKSDLFWVSMRKFIEMVFQKCLMDNEEMSETLLFYARNILIQGETMTGLGNILLKQLQEVGKHYNLTRFEPFAEILIDSLLFGSVQRRDRKIDDETCTFIKALGDKCCINDVSEIYTDVELRGRAIALFLSCQENNDYKFYSKVAHLLLQRDIHHTQQRTRYFADSFHHRYRNRIMQIFMLLEFLLTKEICDQLIPYICKSILTENHQPSIKYFQEWLLIRLMKRNASARTQIWTVLQAASETRAVSVCSFISVAYHLTHILVNDEAFEEFLDKALIEILPCTMIQHFNVRLYAQVSFVNLWELAVENKLLHVTKKYNTIYLCIKANLSTPSALRSVQKLRDFYFSVFNPVKDYSLQTIFYELPRLTKVVQEEWISTDLLLSCGVKNVSIPMFNENTNLQDCELLSTIDKADVFVDEKDLFDNEVVNVQKKIIPWKAMVPDQNFMFSVSESIVRKKQMAINNGLIVVASLIDRTPNLGGLCRTCEVFGVSQYVIGSFKYIEDRQFQALSVTAEQWISIIEVQPHNLPSYLKEMKQKGYTVVGAEQTAHSKSLNEVEFPKRTLLLLGNEKEGIPVNLLPLLDQCVEVPQEGVIRSLNVHVTGAIFIWEYAQQHNKK